MRVMFSSAEHMISSTRIIPGTVNFSAAREVYLSFFIFPRVLEYISTFLKKPISSCQKTAISRDVALISAIFSRESDTFFSAIATAMPQRSSDELAPRSSPALFSVILPPTPEQYSSILSASRKAPCASPAIKYSAASSASIPSPSQTVRSLFAMTSSDTR